MHNHVIEAGMFKFDYFKCLRSEYANNECTICIDICPENAMVFDREKLTLDPDRCTGCGACIGGCPTESLMSDMFDPNTFVVEFSQKKDDLISCKQNVPCLGALSAEHLISIALRKERSVTFDLSHCKECPVNKDNKVLESIESTIAESEEFLRICKKEDLLLRKSEFSPAAGRRGLLKKLAGVVKEVNSASQMTELMVSKDEKQPLKRILLKNSIKMLADELGEDSLIEEPFSFVANKSIDAMSCTNCQQCTIFCPTGALSSTQDNAGIIFQVGKCIACSICNDICEPRSLTDGGNFDLVTFAFDRMQMLVKHELVICEECKVAFPYHGGEKVCDRCTSFKKDHSDFFTLARDL